MFAKALIGFGVSLALLIGNAAGQAQVPLDQTEREPLEDLLARVEVGENGVSSLSEEDQARIKAITKYHTNGAQFCESAEVYWPSSPNHWCLWEPPADSIVEVQALIDDAMSRELADVMGESREIVVIHKGRLVAEAYREGYTADTKLVSWSMAKSITQALVGRAVQEGLIEDIDAPMPSRWEAGDPRSQSTWRQWMTMTDGLDYSEVGETDIAKNDVVQMMFGPGRYDMVGYVEGLEQVHEAGTHWNYSTAAFHMISWALQNDWVNPNAGLALSEDNFDAFQADVLSNLNVTPESNDRDREVLVLARRFMADAKNVPPGVRAVWAKKELTQRKLNSWLFAPLGMDAQPEFDASGTFLGGSLVYASARDFARFGYLYLRDGVWDGERLLPEGWVEFATTAHEGSDTNVYGAGWWITPDEGDMPTHAQSAISAPYDAFHAGGNEGQTIWVVPSKDLVIVRLGLMSNAPENWAALYEWNQKVARAFPDK